MAVGGLDYSIRKKLDTQYLRDMTQLDDRVRQVKRLKVEKAITNKYHKREKIAYVEVDGYPLDIGDECVKESEVNMDELKPRPPYVFKLLKPSNGKKFVNPNKNEKFVAKTYTFDNNKIR